jgi:hypothetical protein
MSSETEIASNALTKLGAQPITSIVDDTTQRANLCRAYYYNVRDAVLRAYPWKCATEQAALAREIDAPVFGYAYKFKLPVEPYCLRVLIVEDDPPYDIKGRYLYTDESSVNIEFIKRIEDPGEFDALLSEAIECRLAAELAWPVTKDSTLIKNMWALYEAKLREARTIDGMEAPEDPWESNALIEVR